MPTPVLFDNLQPETTTGDQLDTVLKGAQTLDICIGFLSTPGLEKLAAWLDGMSPESRVRLLVGMAPEGWKDWGVTAKAAATFLARHLQQQGANTPPYRERTAVVLDRLEQHRRAGRLEVRQRLAARTLHAKLYLWTDHAATPAALIGSSNLTDQGLSGQGELNVYVRREASLTPLAAWFAARWQEDDSFHAPQVLADARVKIQKVGPAKRQPAAPPEPDVTPARSEPQPSKSGLSGCFSRVVGLFLLTWLFSCGR